SQRFWPEAGGSREREVGRGSIRFRGIEPRPFFFSTLIPRATFWLSDFGFQLKPKAIKAEAGKTVQLGDIVIKKEWAGRDACSPARLGGGQVWKGGRGSIRLRGIEPRPPFFSWRGTKTRTARTPCCPGGAMTRRPAPFGELKPRLSRRWPD